MPLSGNVLPHKAGGGKVQQTCELAINERLFEQNASIVVSRWPNIWSKVEASNESRVLEVDTSHTIPALIIDNIHLHSCFNTDKEVKQQLEHLGDVGNQVYCYGIGSGELIRELLRRYPGSRINVVILNVFVFKVQMALYHWYDWLEQESVELIDGSQMDDVKVPFAVAPAELMLASPNTKSLADQLQLELNTDEINRRFIANASENLHANKKLIAKRPKLSDLLREASNKYEDYSEVVVVGAGPSLDKVSADRLIDKLIICVDAAFKPLLEKGITPHLVVSIDFSEKVKQFLSTDKTYSSTLIAFPTVHPEVLTSWQGECYFAYSQHPVFKDVKVEPSDILYSAGSVIHPAVDLAVKFGKSIVNLIGADFCFEGNKTHVSGSLASFANNQQLIERENFAGQRVTTNQSLLSYALDLERYISSQSNVKFISLSKQGLPLKGVAYA